MATQPAKIDTLELDAAVSEGATFGAQVSDHPVEVGSNIVDHIRPLPVEVRLDGVVTDTPVSAVQMRRAAALLNVGTDDAPSALPGRADAALAFLIELRTFPRLVTVVTSRRVYENMALTSLVVPTDRATGEALRFSAAFRQVVTVELRRVQIATPPRPARSTLKKNKDGGTQPTKTTPPETQDESALFSIEQSDTIQTFRQFWRGP